MNASLQVLGLLTAVLVCPFLSSQKAVPSARPCPIAAACSRFSGSIVRRLELRRVFSKTVYAFRNCQGVECVFQLHSHGPQPKSCRCFGRRTRMTWSPFTQKWLDGSARVKMLFRMITGYFQIYVR
jgi:hypothetical protein